MESSKKNISRYCRFKGTVSLNLHSSYIGQPNEKRLDLWVFLGVEVPEEELPGLGGHDPVALLVDDSRRHDGALQKHKFQILYFICNFYNFICYKKLQFTHYSNIRKIICNAIRDDNFRVIIFTRHHAQVNMQIVREFFLFTTHAVAIMRRWKVIWDTMQIYSSKVVWYVRTKYKNK